MRVTKAMKEVALKAGLVAAKVNTNTTCLWINYQPKEPNAITKMRQRKL